MVASALFTWLDLRRRRFVEIVKERQGETISFENLSYGIGNMSVLRNISGMVEPGQILAIMGPSGAGKTTFLDILAKKRKHGMVGGKITFGSEVLGLRAFKSISGYVDQEDLHLATMTVREVIQFSATLRLPESMTFQQKAIRVDEVIKKLGLSHISSHRIGDSIRRGISGGEKRRVSIGCELVTNPCILFLDEPTSGLDSYNATQVMQALVSLAHDDRKTIIFTIHQPRSDIFQMFDRVLLISNGESIFFGPVSASVAFCESRKLPCAEGYNMADHLLDIAAGNNLETVVCVPSKPIKPLSASVKREKGLDAESNSLIPKLEKSVDSLTSSFVTQLVTVLGRSWTNFWRRPVVFWAHLTVSIALGLFIGAVYFKVDSSLAGIQNRLGSIFFLQSLLGFAGLSAMTTFSADRVLFVRERSNGFYGPLPFFYSKVCADFTLDII